MQLMKTKSNFWISLFTLAAGIALIATHSDGRLLSWIVVIIGWLFIIPGVIGLIITALSGRKNTAKSPSQTTLNTFSYAVSLIVGLIFVIWPQTLAGIFIYVLAAVMVASGLWEIIALATSRIPGLMPWWLYILPVLTIAAGIFLFTSPTNYTESLFTLIAGIALTCVGANGIFMSVNNYSVRRTLRHNNTNALNP